MFDIIIVFKSDFNACVLAEMHCQDLKNRKQRSFCRESAQQREADDYIIPGTS
jgi:hypothetical protein